MNNKQPKYYKLELTVIGGAVTMYYKVYSDTNWYYYLDTRWEKASTFQKWTNNRYGKYAKEIDYAELFLDNL